ncbi:hypothetical protein CW304_00260 [Bacillus sp. UFRGS-B20]|nr:hypothetical protein CW304_00260 [Bacillus sp. UFRGS-B20]
MAPKGDANEITISWLYISELASPFTDNSLSLNFEVGSYCQQITDKKISFFLKEDDFFIL